MALIGICDLIGTIGSGWLSDRYDNRWLLAWYYGLDFIATVPPSVRLTAKAFGREQAPLVFGWIFAAHQLGSGMMAFAAGQSRDALSRYLPAFLSAGVLCLLATLSLWLLRGSRSGPAVAATVRPA